MRKPYFKRSHQCWYVKAEDGRREIRLDPDETKAYGIWHEILEAGQPESPTAPVASVVESFLQYAAGQVARGELKQVTLDGYGFFLGKFCAATKGLRLRELRPFHVTRWLDKATDWGTSSRRAAITAVKRVMNWAVNERILVASPLRSLARPTPPRREVLIADDQHAAMIAATDANGQERRAAAIRPVLIALRHSGARPGMVAAVTCANVSPDASCWILPEHKTKRKLGRPLVIYLSPCLQTLTRIAMARRGDGPLFVTARGTAWTSNAITLRMRRMRDRLGLPAGTVAYSYRHSFATQAILNGADVATVAELLGHGDVKMIQQHYGHLAAESDHLKAAAAKAVKRTG